MIFFIFTDFNHYCIIEDEIFYVNFYLNKNLIFYNKLLLNFSLENIVNFVFYFNESCVNFKCKSLFSMFETKKLWNNNLLLCCDVNFYSYFLIT